MATYLITSFFLLHVCVNTNFVMHSSSACAIDIEFCIGIYFCVFSFVWGLKMNLMNESFNKLFKYSEINGNIPNRLQFKVFKQTLNIVINVSRVFWFVLNYLILWDMNIFIFLGLIGIFRQFWNSVILRNFFLFSKFTEHFCSERNLKGFWLFSRDLDILEFFSISLSYEPKINHITSYRNFPKVLFGLGYFIITLDIA